MGIDDPQSPRRMHRRLSTSLPTLGPVRGWSFPSKAAARAMVEFSGGPGLLCVAGSEHTVTCLQALASAVGQHDEIVIGIDHIGFCGKPAFTSAEAMTEVHGYTSDARGFWLIQDAAPPVIEVATTALLMGNFVAMAMICSRPSELHKKLMDMHIFDAQMPLRLFWVNDSQPPYPISPDLIAPLQGRSLPTSFRM